jgi:hypothetical protein
MSAATHRNQSPAPPWMLNQVQHDDLRPRRNPFPTPPSSCYVPLMELPDFLRFTPVAVRAQHNGWSPGLQLRFILALARGAGPQEAARALGKTRQSAYLLRNRPGAESFAAAWDAALAFAQSVERAGARLRFGGIDTILVPRTYRGRIIGFVQREDIGGAMRLLGRLDRIAERMEGPSRSAAAGGIVEAFLAGGRARN